MIPNEETQKAIRESFEHPERGEHFESVDDFIEKVYDILLDEGQNDGKFEWGEVIKFKPSEVREVLFRRKDEFKS